MQWVSKIKRKIKFISFAQLAFLASVSIFSILLMAVSVSRLLEKSQKSPTTTNVQDAVVIEQKGDTAIKLPRIDQARLSFKIQSLWNEALTKGSTKLATFPHDPELVAFKYYKLQEGEPSLVVYKNKPIIVRLVGMEPQVNTKLTDITLESSNYQLVVVFSYTKNSIQPDIEDILEQSFAEMIAND